MRRCYITKVFPNFSVAVEWKTTSKLYSDTFTHFEEIFLVRQEAYSYQRKLVLLPIHIENQLNTITQFKHAWRIKWINAIYRCAYSWTKARTEDYKNPIFMESLLWYILIRFVYRDIFCFCSRRRNLNFDFLLLINRVENDIFHHTSPFRMKKSLIILERIVPVDFKVECIFKREQVISTFIISLNWIIYTDMRIFYIVKKLVIPRHNIYCMFIMKGD